MKKLFLALICFLLLPLAVSAQGSAGLKTRFSSSAASTSPVVKGALARCAVVESKIQIKATNFDNNKVKHLEIYNTVKSRIEAIMAKLSTQGVDTSGLKSQLAVYEQKIKKFSDDYAIYIDKLKQSQGYVCGKSEGQFRTKLKEAKAALAQVHKDAVEIRTYYAQTLKPEINRIRMALRKQKGTTTPAAATDTEPVVDEAAN